MNRSTLFILVLFLSTSTSAQVTRKVLFLGNSYTGTNNLPQLIHDVTESAGDSLIFDSNTPGGYTLEAHTLDNVSVNKIALGGWDHVVLQGQSLEPILNPGLFNQAGGDLNDLIDQDNPCAVPMLYMTWGRKNGHAGFCNDFPETCTYQSMDSALRVRYENMADVRNFEVSPVSVVWRYLRNNHPSIELYSQDESHPSAAGSYAAACCFYTAIFKNDPTLITYNFGLNATDAATIRNAAKTVVYDDLEAWDYKVLPNSSFTYSIGSGTNQVLFNAPGFGAIQTYAWDFGDGNTDSTGYPSHSYATNGTYTVELTTTNCDIQGVHTSTSDTVIQFCDHTPTITTTNPWLCNYDTLWTQPAAAYQWFADGQPIPETGPFVLDYQQYNSFNFSVLTTENGCSELSQTYNANPEWHGYFFDSAWGGDPCEADTALFIAQHFSGDIPGSTILNWYRNEELLTSETNEDTLRITEGGSYWAEVVDPGSNCPEDTVLSSIIVFDCGSDTTDTTINDTAAGLNKLRMSGGLVLYPNPTSNLITVEFEGEAKSEVIEFYNATGRLVQVMELKPASKLDVSDWPNGLYYARPQHSTRPARKFIKQ